jgi:hypothetical protein
MREGAGSLWRRRFAVPLGMAGGVRTAVATATGLLRVAHVTAGNGGRRACVGWDSVLQPPRVASPGPHTTVCATGPSRPLVRDILGPE